MPRLKLGRRIHIMQMGENTYHCTRCYKNYKGWTRTLRHHKRTGHDGFIRQFRVTLSPKNPS